MSKRTTIRTSGPPVVCAECRETFKPSVVIGHKVSRIQGLKCPRCVRDDKAAKRRRKLERNEK